MFATLSSPLQWKAARVAALVAALAGLFALSSMSGVLALGGGAARPAAPAVAYSAARVLADARALAQAPRPIASDANARARALVVERLTAIGLAPRVQVALAQTSRVDGRGQLQLVLGRVHNVVALIPGTGPGHASRPALLLATAYDSGERSVGASGAATVAALLEALRLQQAMAPLANDVVVLFADGEQVGGLGARAFAAADPLAARVGLVGRFDSAGSGGAPLLVGAGGIDGAAIAAALDDWARATPAAGGGAALQLPYQDLPGVQMGDLRHLGSAWLHLANVEDSNGSGDGSRDTVARLSASSVAQRSASMLALLRQFGEHRLPAPGAGAGIAGAAGAAAGASDAAGTAAAAHGGSGGKGAIAAAAAPLYFTLPAVGMVSYATGHVWAVTRLTCLMLLIVCCLAVQRGQVSVRDIVNGTLGFVLVAAVLVLAAALVWSALPSLHRGYDARTYGAGTGDAWFLGGYVALGGALFVLLQRRLRHVVGHAAAALGPVVAATALLLVLSWRLPQASYVLAWPLVGTLAAQGLLYAPAASGNGRWSGHWRAGILAAGALPALLILGPLLCDVATLTSPERSELPMLALALLLGMASVLLTAQRRFIVRGMATAAIACFAVAGSAAPYESGSGSASSAGAAPLPQPNRLVYLKDAATWKSYWMVADWPASTSRQLDPWTRGFFPAAGGKAEPEAEGWHSRTTWLAPAPAAALAYPLLRALGDSDDGRQRHLRFTLAAKVAVPLTEVSVSDSITMRSSVNGRLLSQRPTASYTLRLYGMGGELLDFRFDVASARGATIEVVERRPGLPELADVPATAPSRRPAPPSMTPMTATTIARDSLVFR